MDAVSLRPKEFDLRSYDELTIALVSDTHGELAPEVADVVRRSDVVLHAGDIMGQLVLDNLEPGLGVVIAVRGNNDFDAVWHARSNYGDVVSELPSLPQTAVVHCKGGTIGLVHGHRLAGIEQDHFPLAHEFPGARLVVYGHTHVQRADLDSNPWLINPGVAGYTRNKGGASCALLHVSEAVWRAELFRFPAVAKAV